MATVEREGRTVVFVSHNLEAIVQLCPRAIWLDQGATRAIGPAGEVVDAYLGALGREVDGLVEDRGGPVALRSVQVLDAGYRPVEVMRRDQPFTVELRFAVRTVVPGLDVAVHLYNVRGVEVLSEAWGDAVLERPNDPGEYVARLEVPPVLNVGEYAVGVWIGTRHDTFIQETALRRFGLEGDVRGRPRRVMRLDLPWDVRRLGRAEQSPPSSIEPSPARRKLG
jgi:ABC-2 type transport system ATP-binding protein/lipopolysaccharide transport system ATP-binding protein